MLEHYGWVDKNAGVVRIPVERAIDVLAEKGLPYRRLRQRSRRCRSDRRRGPREPEGKGAH